MEGSSNAVTEQFLANICLDSQLSPVQKDIQIKHITNTKLHISSARKSLGCIGSLLRQSKRLGCPEKVCISGGIVLLTPDGRDK